MAALQLALKDRNVELFIGAALALSIGLSATFLGLDRDRAFYPTVMIVIASYYALFAIMGGSVQVLAFESIAMVAFLVASIAGVGPLHQGPASRPEDAGWWRAIRPPLGSCARSRQALGVSLSGPVAQAESTCL